MGKTIRLNRAKKLLEELKEESFGEQYGLADWASSDESVKEELNFLAAESAFYQETLKRIDTIMGVKEDHEASQKADQIERIGRHVEPSTVFRIECGICGEAEEDIFDRLEGEDFDNQLKKFSQEMYADGWRYSTSRTYGLVGAMCGDCFETKDDPVEED